jgi:hypothetical protein
MAAFNLNLEVEQGATFRKRLTWKAAGVPVDLTGYSARMQVRADYGAPLLLELGTGDGGIALGGAEGTIELFIGAADTAKIAWEEAIYQMELTAPNGDVLRKLAGNVNVIPEVVK